MMNRSGWVRAVTGQMISYHSSSSNNKLKRQEERRSFLQLRLSFKENRIPRGWDLIKTQQINLETETKMFTKNFSSVPLETVQVMWSFFTFHILDPYNAMWKLNWTATLYYFSMHVLHISATDNHCHLFCIHFLVETLLKKPVVVVNTLSALIIRLV